MKYLYLDQKDISNLVKAGNNDKWGKLLRALVNSGQVAVVLSWLHAYETGRCQPDLRRRIANFVDGLATRRWLQMSCWIERAEVARCLSMDTRNTTGKPVEPFAATLANVHGMCVLPQEPGRWDPRHEFDWLTWRCDPAMNKQAQKIREMQRAWPALRRESRDAGKGVRPSERFKAEKLWTLVPERTDAGIQLSERDRRDYADRLVLARCPALYLSLCVEDNWHADIDASAESGDMPDLLTHPYAVAYCDMVTLDHRMHDTILQTKPGKDYRHRMALGLEEALTRLGYSR